ncbi:flagellar biosynthesis anti-sigma factor FlgM [Acidihalobacter yilgarnensis]|uniref:Negative regulator of flagellin synthesis n=1 Tax=Acidihalobacter yilgarnensis TaxID=2819280 RepID=A0A1D8ITE6_9GAMM|nr:flagellar biosynthesis anti-sigma factor FlgM [Acidihalobacter yilgarnensis]AOU99693.1 flagellar biosynthesis anti-sigma factor FlgM [Acidihalobacter yilgarnensis]
MNIDLKNIPQQGGAKATGDTAGSSHSSALGSTRDTASSQTQTPGTPVASSDSVSLTRSGQQLAQLQAGLAQQPIVDKQRVAQLRQAIQSGQYNINPSQVASKLLSLEGPAKGS